MKSLSPEIKLYAKQYLKVSDPISLILNPNTKISIFPRKLENILRFLHLYLLFLFLIIFPSALFSA